MTAGSALLMLLAGMAPATAKRPPPGPAPQEPAVAESQTAAPAEADDGGAVRVVTPTRFLDTRAGTGRPGGVAGPVGPGQAIELQVAGVGPVPATGVTAVVLNLTGTGPTASTFVTAWPAGEPRPLASNLNLVPGQTSPNLVKVGLGAGGRISLFNNSGTTHLVADVLGYVQPPEQPGGLLVDLAPSRLLDTRNGTGRPAAGRVQAGQTISLAVTDVGGVPATGVSAVVLNVTATEPTTASYVTVFPTGAPRPLASNLNMVAGDTVPNRVVVPVGADGTVSLYNNAGSVHLVADVGGYYTDETSVEGGSGLLRVSPTRLLDTRSTGKLVGGSSLTVQVAGRAGVPGAEADVPPTAAVLNLTATGPTAATFLTAWPSGIARPLASDLNVRAGETRPNLVVVKLGPAGAVDVFVNSGAVDIVVDVFAYYTGGIVLDPALEVLDPPVAAAVTSVSPSAITFTGTIAGLGLAVGQIVGSGPTSGAPHGLLRRITALSEDGGVVTAVAEPVPLDEAILRGSYTGGIDLVPATAATELGMQAVQGSVTAPFDHQILGTPIDPVTASASLRGSLSLTAGLDLRADIGFLSGVRVDFEAALAASVQARLAVTGAYNFLSYEAELYEAEFRPMVFFVGPVPVVVQPEFELDLVVEGSVGASLSAEVIRSESVDVGFRMRDRDIDPFVSSAGTPTEVTVNPPSAQTNFSVGLQAMLEAEFYGGFELGVGVAPQLSAGVNTGDCAYELAFRLDALAEFEAEIFGRDIGDGLEFRSMLWRHPIAEGTLPVCEGDEWSIDTTVPPADLAAALAGPGVTIQSANSSGPDQVGAFTAPFGSIALSGGTVLSTGHAGGAPGPNTASDYGAYLNGPGDPALSEIAGGATYDTADLTIQFVPSTPQVEFTFVFGSEEYTEYVDRGFNDVFAAFVNGTNCAVVDKGFELVPTTVNAINHLRNTLQYRDNPGQAINAQADGLTTVLSCNAAVTPGATNTLRLAIADSGDGIYDAWAFIQRGSLRAVS